MSSQSSTARIAALAAAVTGVLFASQALASGFQVRENSTKNAGRAFSGSAVARDDASVVLNNPAAMVNLKGNTVQADLSVIDLNAKFEGRATTPFGTAVSGGNGVPHRLRVRVFGAGQLDRKSGIRDLPEAVRVRGDVS